MTFRNAFSCQVIKYFLAFTLYRTSNSYAHMVFSIIPCYCTVAVMFTFVCLLVETLMVFALIFKFRKSWWPAFFLWWQPLKSMVTGIFTLFQCCIVALVAFAAVEFFKNVAFTLLFVINLVWLADGNAFLHRFIIFFIIFARNTFRKALNIMSVFRAWFTLICQLIPQRSQLRARLATACFPVDHGFISRTCLTQFIDGVPSRFIFGTHTYTRASLATGLNWG